MRRVVEATPPRRGFVEGIRVAVRRRDVSRRIGRSLGAEGHAKTQETDSEALAASMSRMFEPLPRKPPSSALLGAGRRVRRARHARGWSQRDLQRATGVHQTVISRLERGLRPGLRLDSFAETLQALEPQVDADHAEDARPAPRAPPPLFHER
jgi:DNA-binding Xre family transcriptional regulator